jgi:hypothetical protein
MKRGLFILLVAAALLPFAQKAEAVPAFAKQTNMACQGCHTAFPLLNSVGQQFKKNGYAIPGATFQPGAFPVGARLLGRVIDNKNNGDPTRIDSLHELEIFYAGPVADGISVFAEVEAEDGDDFVMGVKAAVVNYRHSAALNIQAGRAAVFFADPYDTLADGGRRLTAEHKAVLNTRNRVGTGGTENRHRLRDSLQQINVNGQIGPVWYMVGISGGGASVDTGKIGADPDDAQARLALDLPDGSMIGAFYYGGTDTFTTLVEDDFTVYGIDARHDNAALGVTVLAAATWSTDDYSDSATDVEVAGGYIEVLRPFDVGGKALVPLVRYNWADTDGSADDLASDKALQMTTVQVSYYVRENARITTEFTNFDKVVDNQRLIVGFDVAF